MEGLPLFNESLTHTKDLLEVTITCWDDAWKARENALEDSAEWHKRTGELLVYARMTSLLTEIEVLLRRIDEAAIGPQASPAGNPRHDNYVRIFNPCIIGRHDINIKLHHPNAVRPRRCQWLTTGNG